MLTNVAQLTHKSYLFDGLGVVADAIDSSCLEFLEAFLGKVIGATVLGVLAGQISSVEILQKRSNGQIIATSKKKTKRITYVILDGQLSHDELKVVLDKVPNGSMSALLLQEISLGIGDTVEEGESNAIVF